MNTVTVVRSKGVLGHSHGGARVYVQWLLFLNGVKVVTWDGQFSAFNVEQITPPIEFKLLVRDIGVALNCTPVWVRRKK